MDQPRIIEVHIEHEDVALVPAACLATKGYVSFRTLTCASDPHPRDYELRLQGGALLLVDVTV